MEATAMTTSEDKDRHQKSLFDAAIDLLREVDPREFYPRVVEFCAALLDSEVCALYVRTTQIDATPRVCLVAGKLPPGHPKGQRMNPNEVDPDPRNHSYRIGTKSEGKVRRYDGVTGEIATTGEPKMVDGYSEIKQCPGHLGKWDRYVYQGKPEELFRGMLGVAIRDSSNDIIGVIKVENKVSGAYVEEDKTLLTQIGASLADSLFQLINEGRELMPAITEHEYRVPRSRAETFEKEKTGEVIIKHSMTAICHSDLYYFQHRKPRERLDERLPLVLGHETTGEVYQVVGENRYRNGGLIQPKDKVVVIPLIPCGTCEVCKKDYGENYCPSSRFMASNAPGSLRTIYKYYPNLILRIQNEDHEKFALFTEPMSNVVQILQELGFQEGQDTVALNMAPFHVQEFTYFHVGAQSFTNIFDSVTAEEPFPRTLFVLRNPHGSPLGSYRIKHINIMVKGLGLLGTAGPEYGDDSQHHRVFREPKVLILGGGTMGYLLAVLLHTVCGIAEERIVVTGRDPAKLAKFRGIATRQPVGAFLGSDGTYDMRPGRIVDQLQYAGKPGFYDLVFECVGWPAVASNIDLGLSVLKDEGVLALEGMTDQSIEVDFSKLMVKRVFMKGFYRGSLKAYMRSLDYIESWPSIRERLETLIDYETVVDGRQGGFHRVENENQLAALFKTAGSKKVFGRLIVSEIS
jgi:threonine dehydrogenase-like Zn-dependent dehydrogenase